MTDGEVGGFGKAQTENNAKGMLVSVKLGLDSEKQFYVSQ